MTGFVKHGDAPLDICRVVK